MTDWYKHLHNERSSSFASTHQLHEGQTTVGIELIEALDPISAMIPDYKDIIKPISDHRASVSNEEAFAENRPEGILPKRVDRYEIGYSDNCVQSNIPNYSSSRIFGFYANYCAQYQRPMSYFDFEDRQNIETDTLHDYTGGLYIPLDPKLF